MKYLNLLKYKLETPNPYHTTGSSCTDLSQCNWLWRNGLRLLYGIRILSFFPLATASSATRFEESMSRTLLSGSGLQKPQWQKLNTHKNTTPIDMGTHLYGPVHFGSIFPPFRVSLRRFLLRTFIPTEMLKVFTPFAFLLLYSAFCFSWAALTFCSRCTVKAET